MIPILGEILCVLQRMAAAIITLLVVVIDGMVIAVGLLLAAVIALLPQMPDAPEGPGSGVLGFINWLFPLAGVAALLSTMGVLFAGFMLVRVALNWVRAL